MNIVTINKDNLDMLPRACGSVLPSEIRKISWEAKKVWVGDNLEKGYKMKIALDKDGYFMGLIEYLPVQHSLQRIEGENLLCIDCIWVLNQYQKQGAGKKLLLECLEDAKNYDGTVTWATDFLIMNYKFFEHFGFKIVDKEDVGHNLYLMLKSEKKDIKKPRFIRAKYHSHVPEGSYKVDLFYNPWCPYSYGVILKAKNIIESANILAKINEFKLSEKSHVEKFGISVGVFINNKDYTLDFLIKDNLKDILQENEVKISES